MPPFPVIEYLLDMKIKTIYWEGRECRIIDQTLLPGEFKILPIASVEEMFEAIRNLRVRGAPAIGIAAAMGVYIGIASSKASTPGKVVDETKAVCEYLARSRPTAVNLFWALNRIERIALENASRSVEELKNCIWLESQKMIEEDDQVCRSIGEHGAHLLKDGDTVLTHCNAGGLATASYGTALAVIYFAAESGKRVRVFADETRPLLQGARLTAWELMQNSIDVTLICDNMAGSIMRKGWINAVIVGADRVCRNGDFANKIGTYPLAVLAHEHKIPFYVAAPFSSIDSSLSAGSEIPIEERDGAEVSSIGASAIAPRGVKVYNPAFDVTPARLVSGFITEEGVLAPPFGPEEAACAAKEKNI